MTKEKTMSRNINLAFDFVDYLIKKWGTGLAKITHSKDYIFVMDAAIRKDESKPDYRQAAYSLIGVLCLAIFGCVNTLDECESSRSYPYWTEWSDGELISIVDDSLAILATRKYEKECWTGINGKGEQEVSSKNGLFLVNYRVKQKPLEGNILNYNLNSEIFHIAKNHFTDTSVLVFDGKSNFGFWKIGAEFIKLNKSNENFYSYGGIYASPWINGNIFIRGSFDRAKMYTLDIKTGQMETFEFAGEYEWLRGCDFASYIENKIACVKANHETKSIELIVDGNITDTSSLYYDGSVYYIAFHGNYIIKSAGYHLNEIHKIDTDNFRFSEAFVPVWIWDNKFYKDDKNFDEFIHYSPEDLFGTENSQ